jgi:hypothetical protein
MPAGVGSSGTQSLGRFLSLWKQASIAFFRR